MLSDRITKLFQILQCTNTDIARFSGCSPSNISRLKSGTREPGPESRSVQRLVDGVYRYADYENMLSLLGQLCGTDDYRAETLFPAIITWLYAESDFTAPRKIVPKSKQFQEIRRRSFGERLDQIMTILDLPNGQIASALHVDASLISRYRSGIYHPNRNERIKDKLAEILLEEAERTGRSRELAALFNIKEEDLSLEILMDWLYGKEKTEQMVEALFHSIDTYAPELLLPSAPSEIPSTLKLERYWGSDGLRQSVIRLLTETAQKGGELFLYSDEPMTWLIEDPEYFSLWSYLMVTCIRKNVFIRIIHNMDRIDTEMISAINGWLPLYTSGMIEPYIFRKRNNSRFNHTLFLWPNGAAIYGTFPAEIGQKRWYDYVTDRDRLDSMTDGFRGMLADASPFLKIYPAEKSDQYHLLRDKHKPEKTASILHGLSIGTMPEGLLEHMLDRSNVTDSLRNTILKLYEKHKWQIRYMLDHGSISELSCLPDAASIQSGNITVNLGAEIIDLTLTYRPEEYAAHVLAVCKMIDREKNYHLTLLPHAIFPDLQIFTLKDAVAVLRSHNPYTAFVFLNSAITRAIRDYCEALTLQYSTDRLTLIDSLKSLIT